jgi:uncharacterized protein YwgA
MNKGDLFGVLYLIGASKNLNFRKRLQKLICISKYDNKINYPFSFEFVRFHYGPYSFDLKRAMDNLIVAGLIEERLVGVGYSYSLTKKGEDKLNIIRKGFGTTEARKIETVWKTHQNKTVPEITKEAKHHFGW